MNAMDILQLFVEIGGLISLIIGILTFRKSIRINEDSNYIMAEKSSIEVFKMIIENPELSKLYDDSNSFKISETSKDLEIKMKEYASILLNLFEIQVQLRKSKSICAVRFASWVPWILSLTKGHYFKVVWTNDLRIHYVPEFRLMIDELIKESSSNKEQLYGIVAKHFNNCKVIKNWIKN